MKTYIFRNRVTGDTKPTIRTHSLVLAQEFFETNYWWTSRDWITEEVA